MLDGAKVFVDPRVEQWEFLLRLAEDLGGKAVFDPGAADVVVAPEPLENTPEHVQVLIPTDNALEAFYLFCLCKKHCFSA